MPATTTARLPVAPALEKVAVERALFLHHRRRGAGPCRGDIDHIAVAPSGVWVIGADHYDGAKIRVKVTGSLVGPPQSERLLVGGRDRTALADDLTWQLAAVRRTLSPYGVGARALLCFLDAELPLFALPTVRGIPVLGARDTGRRLRQDGPLDADRRRELWQRLAEALPAG